MPKIHIIQAAKTHLSRLVAQAARGQDVVIARGSEPVARLIAVEAVKPERRFGAMRGRARVTDAFFDPLPADEDERNAVR